MTLIETSFNLAGRLERLLPDALIASRHNLALRQRHIHREAFRRIPQDCPIQIRLAMAEREVLSRCDLDLSDGDLLAGKLRLEVIGHIEDSATTDDPHAPEFPGGQTAHTCLDAAKLLRLGISGVEAEIRDLMATCSEDQRIFYKSCLISLDGFRILSARLREMARLRSDDPTGEMKRLGEVLVRVPEQPARSFHEAIQSVHLLQMAACITVGGLYGPGRLDRILYPYYKADLAAGTMDADQALALICCQYILQNYLFTLPVPVMIGGLGEDGKDTTNELTYLCLKADSLVGLVNPSLGLGVNEQTPAEILDGAAQVLLKGATKPSLFNDRVIIAGLEQRGVPYADAVDYTHSTCAEITVIGKSNIFVASPYFNLMKPLEFMFNDGKPVGGDMDGDPFYQRTPIQPPHLSSYSSFEDILSEYKRQLTAKIAEGAALTASQRKGRFEGWAFPLVSCFTDDCLSRGLDYDRGGARYIWTETSSVGLANIVDSLMVIKRRVFEEKTCSLEQIRNMLMADFPDEGARRQLIRGVPRYGNDEKEADDLAGLIVDMIYSAHAEHTDYLGGPFAPGFFCWIMHRILGNSTGASPDGRRAGEVLADAAGSAQGRDINGPTAAVRSITSWDHTPGLGGIVLNLRFLPDMFRNEQARKRLVELIRTYISLGGFEMQINSVDTNTLRQAQNHPEKFESLVVRIAGYSDYFTLLDKQMQEEVISRTEHGV